MTIKGLSNGVNLELPLQVNVSFEKVYNTFKKYTSDDLKDHPFHHSSKKMVQEIEKVPELINGFSDFSLLEKHSRTVNLLLDALFPEALSTNEIKAATIPFYFKSFKFTERFKTILKNAGDDFELSVRNFEGDKMYIFGCTLILATIYDYPIDLKRPFFFDIPDEKLGVIKHYRVAFNGDFMDITATENAPKLNENDIKVLLDNFDNIEIWKEKFPPNSYIFKGFGIMNLFDVSYDEAISSIRTNLLRRDDGSIVDSLQNNLSEFYSIKDLRVGYSFFDISEIQTYGLKIKFSESIVIKRGEIYCNHFFCDHIHRKLFIENETVVISDTDRHGETSDQSAFYLQLKNNNIGSIILIPIKIDNNQDLVLLEIASPRTYELNSVNKQKLKDVIPVFKAAAERNSEDFLNILEATIQEHYTSIHPSVKWRFYEAAENYQNALIHSDEEDATIEEIVFNDVYPLYAQLDIRGSSTARNSAIQEDLQAQLNAAINVLKKACRKEDIPIYKELMYRVEEYLSDVEDGIKAGDEVAIIDFLKREIYPVFNHIKEINSEFTALVDDYVDKLDTNLQVVYDKRKDYEYSVTKLNEKLAKYIDKKQEEAQKIFPHYFERYKTDGVEYNMYIGQSITKQKKYDSLYLYNLRLWQLQTTHEMENIARNLRKSLSHDLQVASLILVHSNALAIEFRMDEKQFDVDGAYNIRYEIIKKRIDKALIKNTEERLTTPGKIAIVYSQDKDADEYLKYIKFLQSKNKLGEVEMLELEDLQGVSGLKALRVEIIYQEISQKPTLAIDELMNNFK